ncbi:MAG: polyketide synthase, partial [Desulfobacterales bacterium]|nr:polyketide synthase [Desulfobacterales bacterium]
MTSELPLNAIAIIGMACRFPGANDVGAFWENIRDGVESVSQFSDTELMASGVPLSLLNNPDYVKKGFVIDDPAGFDAAFFGYSPREAETMDPQHRLFLETAWHAFEDAGYVPKEFPGEIGIFAGAKLSTYLINQLPRQQLTGSIEGFQVLIGNDKDYLTSRISYKLNLRGPSVSVQTACSTSLVAVHMACESLLSGACDMALAGGVGIMVPQKEGYLFQEGMILSKDGHCRPFDAGAKGIAGGNGMGAVLLKPLEAAITDRDRIHAVILGSAVNNDGDGKAGYTAPSMAGQAAVIREALNISQVSPDTIDYIEAHGTGTEIGDPMEISALSRVFREKTDRKGFCAIGSVKANIGHLDTAAGVASLIKTVMALKHNTLPPSPNFRQPNPRINFMDSPFFVNDTLKDWGRNSHPRRAGVSSFGFGG